MYYGIMMCSSERKTHTAVQEGSANIFVMWSVFKLVFSGSLVSLGASDRSFRTWTDLFVDIFFAAA